MKKMFSRLGIPETLRSDNGPQYIAQVFKEFSKEWNFKHVTSSPEYPKSNGFVERHIQIVKNLLTKAKQSGKDPYLAMLESRNCPVENSSSPAQLIYGRCLRSLLPIYQEKLKIKSINDDDIQDQKFQKQSKQAFYYDQHAKCQKQLKEGQDVYVYQNEKWKEAVVEKKCAEPRSYIIKTQDGKIYRRNRNRLRPVQSEETSVEISDNENDNVDDENQVKNEKLEMKSENQPSPKTAVRTTRYGRVVKPPRRYDEYESH